jgi:predicted ATPase
MSAPAFAGREHELAALTAALAGPGAVVLVEGEAGIGKSRLIREYLATRPGQQVGTLVASCPPFRRPHTLGPLADAVSLICARRGPSTRRLGPPGCRARSA